MGTYADSLPLPGFNQLSEGVDLVLAADDEGFTAHISHTKGDLTYGYDSEDGLGIVEVEDGDGGGGAMG